VNSMIEPWPPGCEDSSSKFRLTGRARSRKLRRTFVYQRDEVAVEWRKLRSMELYDLYSSPYVVTVIKSRTEPVLQT
jgi:hypothetical protein